MNATLTLADVAAGNGLPGLKCATLAPEAGLLEAYKAAGLSGLKDSAAVNARIALARNAGLLEITPFDAAVMLYRSMNHLSASAKVREVDPLNSVERIVMPEHEVGDWGCVFPNLRHRFKARFCEKMTFRTGKVTDLCVPVPRGVALRVAEAKESGVFDEVFAVAPREAFIAPQRIDPIILGSIHAKRNVDGLVMSDGTFKPVTMYTDLNFWMGTGAKHEIRVVPTGAPITTFLLALWH